jgi:hypothetical protein
MGALALIGTGCLATTELQQDEDEAAAPEADPTGAASPGATVDDRSARLYLGDLEGAEAKVAVSIRSDGFTDIYVCGTDGNHDTHSRWFCPEDLVDGAPEVVVSTGGWTLHAERRDPVVRGTLHSPIGGNYRFELVLAGGEMRAATFQHREGPNNCSGAILWQEPGKPVELVGTFCYPGGYAEQVAPILSAPPTADAAVIKLLTQGDLSDEIFLFNTLLAQ